MDWGGRELGLAVGSSLVLVRMLVCGGGGGRGFEVVATKSLLFYHISSRSLCSSLCRSDECDYKL